MTLPSHATLILAGALPDSAWLPPKLRDQAAQNASWCRFVSRARLVEARIEPAGSVPEPGHLRYLAQCFQLERPAVWPALELQVELGHELSSHSVWRLQPVHFLLGRDHIRLMDPRVLNLGQDEAQALLRSAQPVFEAEGLRLGMHAPGVWWLTPEAPSADLCLETFSLVGAVGRSIEARLPQGEHRRRWQRLLNECQMIWHTHPVNGAREARGQLPINGLWLEGPTRGRQASSQSAVDASSLRHRAQADSPLAAHQVDTRLLEAQSSGDPSAWHETWQRVCREYFEIGPQTGAGAKPADVVQRSATMMPGVTVLTGDSGWRMLGPQSAGLSWAHGLRRLLGRGSSQALDWLMP